MATQTNLILVTGATGQQGGAVARALMNKGQKIRVMTRHPEKATALVKVGDEVVKGDLTNETDLQAALRGIYGVFAMSTPFEAGMDAEIRQGVLLADAAKQAGVGHYIYTSVGNAHRHTGIPHFESKWQVEQHIAKIGLPATILRPVFFMENFTTFARPSPEGVLTMPMRPDKKLAMVAVRDIGQFGAAAFSRIRRPHLVRPARPFAKSLEQKPLNERPVIEDRGGDEPALRAQRLLVPTQKVCDMAP